MPPPLVGFVDGTELPLIVEFVMFMVPLFIMPPPVLLPAVVFPDTVLLIKLRPAAPVLTKIPPPLKVDELPLTVLFVIVVVAPNTATPPAPKTEVLPEMTIDV